TSVCALLQHQPQPNMVPPVRTSAVRLLERQLLLLALIVERTDRRITVGPVKYDAADDFHAGAQRDRISWEPAGCVHGEENVVAAPDQPDIERVARNPGPGLRHHR